MSVAPAVKVTEAGVLQVRPAEGFAASETVPANPPVEVTVIVEEPELVARIVEGVTALVETVKLGPGTVTVTVTVLDSAPEVPVTRTLNPVAGNGLQLTDKTAPGIVAVQPVGAPLAPNVTTPENPLIGVTEIVEVPAVPAVARAIVDGFADNMKSWTVTETVVALDSVLGAVPVVPVTGTGNVARPFAQVTDKTAPVNEPEQPDGKTKPALTAHDTLPVNPLIAAAEQVEEPATVARVVIAVHDGVKSTTWNVTAGVEVRVIAGVPPTPVTVAV